MRHLKETTEGLYFDYDQMKALIDFTGFLDEDDFETGKQAFGHDDTKYLLPNSFLTDDQLTTIKMYLFPATFKKLNDYNQEPKP